VLLAAGAMVLLGACAPTPPAAAPDLLRRTGEFPPDAGAPDAAPALAGLLDLSAALAAAPAPPLAMELPLEGALFPADLAPASFEWAPGPVGAARWLLRIDFAACPQRVLVFASEPRWLPDAAAWTLIQRCSLSQAAEVRVWSLPASGQGPALGVGRTHFSTSPDPVGAAILYRDVPLPFLQALRSMDEIRWHLVDPRSLAPPPVILEKLPVCANCHSLSSDGRRLGMDADYANDKGAYAVLDVAPEMRIERSAVFSWSEFEPEPDQVTFGLLSQLSPDGRFVVGTVKDRSLFVPRADPYFSQLFFPAKGILAVRDLASGSIRALPGASDPEFVQSSVGFSPDGRELVFARAPLQRAVLERLASSATPVLAQADGNDFQDERYAIRYDLYRLPFAAGEGGVAQPLAGASGNGRSNYFPRFTPDGRHVVFTQAERGMLLAPGSELYVVPAAGGVARRMTCNRPHMNSWHSISPNGRWMVFASKGRGPFTQLWLTHLDADANDTPPVLLERCGGPGRAANIPEFVPGPPGSIQHIRANFLDEYSYYRNGLFRFLHLDAPDLAERDFRQALELAPAHVASLRNLGMALARQGRGAEAQSTLQRAAALAPDSSEVFNALGIVRAQGGAVEAALAAFRRALELAPRDENLHFNVARLLAQDPSHQEEAVREYRAGLALAPRHEAGRAALLRLLEQQGRWADALRELDVLAAGQPPSADLLLHRGSLQERGGDRAAAHASFSAALAAEPGSSLALFNLGRLEAERAETLSAALAHFRQGLTLEPANLHARLFYGDLLEKAGQVAAAAEQYGEALRLAPQDPALQARHEELLRAASRPAAPR